MPFAITSNTDSSLAVFAASHLSARLTIAGNVIRLDPLAASLRGTVDAITSRELGEFTIPQLLE